MQEVRFASVSEIGFGDQLVDWYGEDAGVVVGIQADPDGDGVVLVLHREEMVRKSRDARVLLAVSSTVQRPAAGHVPPGRYAPLVALPPGGPQ